MKPGSFIFDGVSSVELNTYIQDRPLIEAPLRKVEWKNAYSVDGSIPFDEQAYENTNLEMLLVIDGKDLIESRQEVYNLIDSKGVYREFIPYFDPNKIYRVMVEQPVEFENKYYYKNAQASSVKFTVKPYKYLLGDHTKIFTSKEFTIDNPTNYVSQPIIRLMGEGDVSIVINDVEFKIHDLDNKGLTIDSEKYMAYIEGSTGPLKSANDKIFTREYPLLRPNRNYITIKGIVSKITINPRWRSLV